MNYDIIDHLDNDKIFDEFATSYHCPRHGFFSIRHYSSGPYYCIIVNIAGPSRKEISWSGRGCHLATGTNLPMPVVKCIY